MPRKRASLLRRAGAAAPARDGSEHLARAGRAAGPDRSGDARGAASARPAVGRTVPGRAGADRAAAGGAGRGRAGRRQHPAAGGRVGFGKTGACPHRAGSPTTCRPTSSPYWPRATDVRHSYGGATAVRLVLRRPYLVRSLVLVEPLLATLLRDAGDPLFGEYRDMAERFVRRARRRARRGGLGAVSPVCPACPARCAHAPGCGSDRSRTRQAPLGVTRRSAGCCGSGGRSSPGRTSP